MIIILINLGCVKVKSVRQQTMENAFMRSFVRWESPELMNASLSVLRRIRSTQEENVFQKIQNMDIVVAPYK